MKRHTPFLIILVIAVSVAIIALLIMPGLFGQTQNGLPKNFNTLSRQQQVNVCAGCHPQEHANELLGPHANAYIQLEEHIADANKADYVHRFYTGFLNKVGNTECVRCHATENLFGNWFNDLNHTDGVGIFVDGMFRMPNARSDASSFNTGVDCLTCHYDGSNVIAGKHFSPSSEIDPLRSCIPKPSALLSSDISCLPCHSANMSDMENIYFNANENQTLTCATCHEEFDENNHRTHYTYWRHDPPSKPMNSKLMRFYEPLDVQLMNRTIQLRWENQHLPHAISECPEMVIQVRVTDSLEQHFGSADIRFNLKSLHDGKMTGAFDGQILPGIQGMTPIWGKSDTTVEISLQGGWDSPTLRVDISGLSKPNYWSDDSTGIVRYRSSIPLR